MGILKLSGDVFNCAIDHGKIFVKDRTVFLRVLRRIFEQKIDEGLPNRRKALTEVGDDVLNPRGVWVHGRRMQN